MYGVTVVTVGARIVLWESMLPRWLGEIRRELQDVRCTATSVSNEHGNDNPSRYYLELAQAYQQQPPADWDGVVTLEQK